MWDLRLKRAHEAQLVFSYKIFAECKGNWGQGGGDAEKQSVNCKIFFTSAILSGM